MQVLRQAGELPMEQVMAIENALFAGERLPVQVVPIAKAAVHNWVRAVAIELAPADEPVDNG